MLLRLHSGLTPMSVIRSARRDTAENEEISAMTVVAKI